MRVNRVHDSFEIAIFHKILTGGVSLGLILSTIGTLPAISQNACQAVLTKTRSKLTSKKVQVTYISTFDIREKGWREYPSKYPVGVSVVFEGT